MLDQNNRAANKEAFEGREQAIGYNPSTSAEKLVAECEMIAFLRWLKTFYPLIRQIRYHSEERFYLLVSEYTEDKLNWYAWLNGFHLLLENASTHKSYEAARIELNRLDL